MPNPNLQKRFIIFDEKIGLSYTQDKILEQKRTLLLSNLKVGLKDVFSHEKPILRFESFDQGSYYMQTGIRPIKEDDDYDIDIGLFFYFHRSRYTPYTFKKRIVDALEREKRIVIPKLSCVRVQYHEYDNKAYHVDLALYIHPSCNAGITYLCKASNRMLEHQWQVSNPLKFMALFDNHLRQAPKGDREQFLRFIRYLKAWKDAIFTSKGSHRPTGIAITVCVIKWFKPSRNNEMLYDDLTGLEYLIDCILDDFNKKQAFVIEMPVEPYNNLFEKMTLNQQLTFKEELRKLADGLSKVRGLPNLTQACLELQKHFGTRFPNF
jgi:hypothetical protein